ncbi:hypothetical protein ILUMI_19068 [Ignelater luminosus]|uniref:Uncharacterized protein n=1 Tax=Ignelater luminosus TaxID=2038154 RepID=A0A8K0CGZ6_IGNLU|nr:hypothetical protein ILUMI_19068 [Ignelater luminosus]
MYAKAFLITSMTRNREQKPLVEKLAPVRNGKIIDETYCAVDPNYVPGRKYYHCTSSEDGMDEYGVFKQKTYFFTRCGNMPYAVRCTEFLKLNNVDFVTKVNNAPNIPQVRPIEKYWALLKRECAKRKTLAKNLNSFRQILQTAVRKVSENNGPALMNHLRKKLRQVGRKSIYEAYKH